MEDYVSKNVEYRGYFILYANHVIGSFTRGEAYCYAANILDLDTNQYRVISDRVAQQEYIHLPFISATH
jgi:hypothetical protein